MFQNVQQIQDFIRQNGDALYGNDLHTAMSQRKGMCLAQKHQFYYHKERCSGRMPYFQLVS